MPSGTRPDPPTRCVRLAFNGSYGPAQWSNVMWLFITGTGEVTHDDLLSLAADCGGAYHSNFQTHTVPSHILSSTECVLEVGTGDPLVAVHPESFAGIASGAALPANVAMCISWKTASSWRGGHPRTYIPGIPETSQGDQTSWDDTARGAMATSAIAFHSAVEALTYPSIPSVEHGVVSFVRSNAWRTPPVFLRFTGDAIVDKRIDTQRRRLGKDVAA